MLNSAKHTIKQSINKFKKDFLTSKIKPLLWNNAQDYEYKSAVDFMKSDFFKSILETLTNKQNRLSKGYVDEHTMKEFFANDPKLFEKFVTHLNGKIALEIGPCVASPLSTWDIASQRIVIEPLFEKIKNFQDSFFGKNAFVNITAHSTPAEELIPELVGKVDGALLVRNCIDHSPNWPFILSNIKDYTAPGAYLLIWNDLLHGPGYEDGHYDITDDVDKFRRLIKNLGFDIVVEYQDKLNPNLNWGCLAKRV